jgi:outer membrane protein assembly factor BamB
LDKRLPSKPVASDGKVFFGTVEGEMCAVDAATGFKKWNMNVAGLVASGASPTLGAGVVFFASPFGPSVNALDLESGRQRWQWKDADEPFCESTVIVSVGYRMYLGAGKCGKLFAFESLTGKLAWDIQVPSREGDPVAILNDAALETVLASGANGMLYAFSAATGIEKWRASMGAYQGWYMRPTIATGTVYYLWNGNLNAVEEDSGKPKWRVRLDSLQQTPSNYASTSDHKSLYLADGTLYLIGPDDSLNAYSMQ